MNPSQRRAYQNQAFWGNKKLRRYLLAWLRQGGKTTTLANQALLEMAEHRSRLVTFVSASLGIGSEFIEKEAKTWSEMLASFRTWAAERKMRVSSGERKTEDADSWTEMPENVDWEAIAGAMERSKFEVRLWHTKTIYSRSKVIAPNIATCRSWSGSIKLDEGFFIRDLKTLLAELEPIFSTDPSFTFVMSSTPPPDYAHYGYELLTEESGREDWPVSADGHWYKNRAGMWVHRVTIDDAEAAGRKVFDPESGAVQTPDEARASSLDKEGWDRSNRLKRPLVGTSAISPPAMDAAQRKGMHTCMAGEWEPDAAWIELVRACRGPIAIGIDPATTEGKKSNPTGFSIVEQQGLDYAARLLSWWKTADPAEAEHRILYFLDTLVALGKKSQLKGVSIDATNERYWASRMKQRIHHCPVTLTGGADGVTYRGEKMNFKFYSGSLVTDAAEAGRLILPWHKYVSDDFARVAKAPGTFIASVGANGEHADTFDALRQAIAELQGSGPAWAKAVPVGGDWQSQGGPRAGYPEWWAAANNSQPRSLLA